MLRQKLQASRDSRGSQTALSAGSGSNTGAPDSITYAGGATAVLESGKSAIILTKGKVQRTEKCTCRYSRTETSAAACWRYAETEAGTKSSS